MRPPIGAARSVKGDRVRMPTFCSVCCACTVGAIRGSVSITLTTPRDPSPCVSRTAGLRGISSRRPWSACSTVRHRAPCGGRTWPPSRPPCSRHGQLLMRSDSPRRRRRRTSGCGPGSSAPVEASDHDHGRGRMLPVEEVGSRYVNCYPIDEDMPGCALCRNTSG